MLETTQAIGGAIPGAGGSQIERTTGAIIDHEQFLTLLVTQMQNQDPLEPMSNQEFAAQMAQFGQLERLNSIDGNLVASLEAQVLSTQAVTNTMAASLIGKEVLAAGNSIVLDGGNAKLYVSLADPAEKMTIDIYNDEGKVVWSIQTGAKSAGPQTIAWDGTNNAGDPLPDGIYTYRVDAKDINGQVVELLTATSGIITGVSYESGIATLMVGDLFFPMGDVISISEPGS
jgi:flagellar basal-body rod modification protein FlgD